MTQIGDIVTAPGHPGRWVVMAFEPSPHGRPPAVRLGRPGPLYPTSLTLASPEGLVLVDRPTFEVGARVTAGGFEGTVLSDDGATVRVKLDTRRRKLEGEGSISFSGETDASRGALVRDNML